MYTGWSDVLFELASVRDRDRLYWQYQRARPLTDVVCKAQIPLRRHSTRGKSRTQTISTCQDVCDKVRDKSATNPFVSL